jgi:hypothetical protein
MNETGNSLNDLTLRFQESVILCDEPIIEDFDRTHLKILNQLNSPERRL